jgi:hypothetical protein
MSKNRKKDEFVIKEEDHFDGMYKNIYKYKKKEEETDERFIQQQAQNEHFHVYIREHHYVQYFLHKHDIQH